MQAIPQHRQIQVVEDLNISGQDGIVSKRDLSGAQAGQFAVIHFQNAQLAAGAPNDDGAIRAKGVNHDASCRCRKGTGLAACRYRGARVDLQVISHQGHVICFGAVVEYNFRPGRLGGQEEVSADLGQTIHQ